ncbi:MAG: hypothetical protein ACYCU7_14715 [Acidimicrobiales bacterium]
MVRAAVGVVAVVGLGAGAVHGARSAASLAGARSVAAANLDDRYYDCLTTQARSLVPPGRRVVISTANLANWGTLGKAVAGWAVVTRHRRRAVAVLSLAADHGPGACLGSVVVARYADGAVRRGHGASVPGPGPPPAEPL